MSEDGGEEFRVVLDGVDLTLGGRPVFRGLCSVEAEPARARSCA
jgi:hypothetical protein